MGKFFTIFYEQIGSRKIDSVMFWANSIGDAVKQFCRWDQNTVGIPCGFSWFYTESAIIKIEC